MERFIKIFDNSTEFPLQGRTLAEQYVELGIEGKNACSKKRVDDEIVRRVLDCVKYDKNNYLGKEELDQIKKALIYRSELEQTEGYEVYIQALEQLNSIGGNRIQQYLPFTEEDKWKEAMGYLKTYIRRNPQQPEFAKSFRKKEMDRADAAKRVQKHGASVSIKHNDLVFDSLSVVTRKISEMVRSIGGVRFVEALISHIPFNADTGRLEPFKRGNTLNPRETGPDYPFGYLLNLGIRHANSEGDDSNQKKYFKQVIQMATDYCVAVHPVINHHILEDIFHRDKSPTSYFKRLTILDTIYYIQQNNRDLALEIYGSLLDRLEAEGYELPDTGFSLQEYKAAMREIALLSEDKKFARVNARDIKSIDGDDRKKRFLQLVSKNAETVNRGYEEPLDYDKVDYWGDPLLMLPNGDAMLYPSTIGVGGWYETLMSLLREQYNDREMKSQMDSFVGMALEGFVRGKFDEKGIAPKHGKYRSGRIEGECDIVVESNDKIFLIEMKKKNMTRAARQGHDYQIVLDLAGSLLDSQEQCFRTKKVLMTDGHVELEENGNTVMLDYGNRRTEQITLTLNDYASIQERVLLKPILEIFMKYKFSVKDGEVDATGLNDEIKEGIKRGYIGLAKKQKQLRESLAKIYEMESRNTPKTEKMSFNPFFDSWFLNIEQLCYLLNNSQNIHEFETKLDGLKFLTFGTRDFWAELPLKTLMRDSVMG